MLVSLPGLIPLVILRGSGPTTAALARVAAEHGVRTIAHAEGGGVLYLHETASRERALAVAEASLDRLGVCNRLNLVLVDRRAVVVLSELLALFERLGLEPRGTERAGAHASMLPLDRPLGHEWAGEAERVATVTVDVVDTLKTPFGLRTKRPRGSRPRSWLTMRRRLAVSSTVIEARWLSGTPQLASQTGSSSPARPRPGLTSTEPPGPRGPVTYRDLWLRQYQVIGHGTQQR